MEPNFNRERREAHARRQPGDEKKFEPAKDFAFAVAITAGSGCWQPR